MNKFLLVAICIILLFSIVYGVTYKESITTVAGFVDKVAGVLNSVTGMSGLLSDRLTPFVKPMTGYLGTYYDEESDVVIDIAEYIVNAYTPKYDQDERFNTIYSYELTVSPKVFSYSVEYMDWQWVDKPFWQQSFENTGATIFWVDDAIRFDLKVTFSDYTPAQTQIYNIYVGKPIYNDKVIYNPPDVPYVITVTQPGAAMSYTSLRYSNVSEFIHSEVGLLKKLNGSHLYYPDAYKSDLWGNVSTYSIMDKTFSVDEIVETDRNLKDYFELFYEME